MSRQAGNTYSIAHIRSVNDFLSTLKSKQMEMSIS